LKNRVLCARYSGKGTCVDFLRKGAKGAKKRFVEEFWLKVDLYDRV
jgi:hypothetical protein